MRPSNFLFALSLFVTGLAGTAGAEAGEAGAKEHSDWLTRIGGEAPEILHAIDTDADGNPYLAGIFSDFLETAAGRIDAHAGGQDGFIAGLSSDGAVQWVRGFGGEHSDTLASVAVGGDGGIYGTGQYSGKGSFAGAADGPSITPAGLADMFLVKLDAGGSPLWARSYGGEYGDVGQLLARAPESGVYLGGHFQLSASFGDVDQTLESRGNTDVVIARVDGEGETIWLRHLGGAGADTISDLDSAGGRVVATGMFHGTANLGEVELESAGSADVWVASFGADGAVRWTTHFGNAKSDNPGKVAVAPDGSMVFAGSLQGSWEVGDHRVASAGAADLVVVRWNADGELLWARRFGGAESETTEAIRIGPEGRIYLAGSFSGETVMGDFKATAGDSDAFVLEMQPDGTVSGFHHFPARGVERILGLRVIAPGVVAVGGIFHGEMAVGDETIESAGKNDIFVGRLRLH